MDQRGERRALRACCAGIVNQAVIANVTAILFVPLMRLYGFTYLQLGLLTAIGFAAQLSADLILLFFIDRAPRRALAVFACALSSGGLALYGFVPYLFAGRGAVYAGIAAATAVFAFAGGMLEVILSNVADSLPARTGELCLLHTVYAWAQVVLSLLLLLFLRLGGSACWNLALFVCALVPLSALVLLLRCRFPAMRARLPARGTVRPFYLLALFAVFFGYGAEVVMNQWVSVFAADVFAFEGGSTLGCALFALCLGAGGAAYVGLSRRRGTLPAGILAAAALFAAAAYLAAGLLRLPAAALGAAIVCGMFVGVLSPGAMTAATDALPHAGGWMLASFAVAQDISAAALPAAAGALSDAFSLRGAFLVSAAAPLLAAVFLWAMHRTRPPVLRGGP